MDDGKAIRTLRDRVGSGFSTLSFIRLIGLLLGLILLALPLPVQSGDWQTVIDSGSGSGKTAAPSNGNAWQIERSDNLNYHTPKNNDSEPCQPLIFPLEFEAPLLYDENTPGVNPTRKIGGHIQISINQDLKVTMQIWQPDNGSRKCLNGSFTTIAKFNHDRKLLSFSTSGTGVKSYIFGSGRRDKQVKIWVSGNYNLRPSQVMVSGWSGRISYNSPTRTQSINRKTHAVWRYPCSHKVQDKIEVKVRFDDEDDLLTPSDEAHLKISVTNSTRQKLDEPLTEGDELGIFPPIAGG